MQLVVGNMPTVAGMAITFGILGDNVPALKDVEVPRDLGRTIPQTGDWCRQPPLAGEQLNRLTRGVGPVPNRSAVSLGFT